MRTAFANAVGGTRVSRVQFGVPSNCHGMRAVGVDGANCGDLYWQTVSGATPETTRGTRVLHTSNEHRFG